MSFDPWSQLEYASARLAALNNRRRTAERAGDTESLAELAAEIAVAEATRQELAAWILAQDTVAGDTAPRAADGTSARPATPLHARPRRVS